MELILNRLQSDDDGTFGVLSIEGKVFCVTLERENFRNRTNVSCIPPGEYICSRIKSQTFGETLQVESVQGRTQILFHTGNKQKDTKGCILVGREYGFLDGEKAILRSKDAFKELMEIVGRRKIVKLSVRNLHVW